jgi:acetoin utilization deacetylase AcuC-like enzyme
MKYALIFVAIASIGLSGCVVVPEYPAAQVVITGGGGHHCPPGQAKKGRC